MASAAETPKPPDDLELRNIIDKLAQFVARNGSDFENMTKQKQKDNPRFSFLFGGDYFPYYMYKVNAEQAIMRKQKMQADQSTSTQIQILQHQLRESEKNLRLQYDALMKQQQTDIDEATLIAERDQIQSLADQFGLKIKDFASHLNSLQNSCSKDAIATNKNWCLTHCQSIETSEVVLKFLINKLKDSSVLFTFKLHILYLLNDLIHNYVRKQNQPMISLLENYVCTAYCCVFAGHGSEASCAEKLDKLKSIWLNQKYFSEITNNKLSNAQATFDEYRETINKNFDGVVTEVRDKIKTQYQQYEAQHQTYAKHVQQQISLFEMSLKPPPSTPAPFSLGNQPQLSPMPPLQQVAPQPKPQPLFAQVAAAAGVAQAAAAAAQSPQSGGAAATPQRRSRFDTGPAQQRTPLMSIPTSFPGPINMPQTYSTEQNPMMGGGAGHQQQPYGARPPWPPQLDQQQPHMHGAVPPYPRGPYPGQPGGPGAGLPFYPPPGYPPYQQSGMAVAGPAAQQQQHSGSGLVAKPLMSLNPLPPGMRPFGQPGQAGPGWRPAGPPMAPHGPMAMMGDQGPRPMQAQPLIPKVPYYDLPAALMVPLVQLEDDSYEPLDPNKIRLPPPMAPSERLMAAVEAFYSPANHENPRDSDGWERLGLYEFFKAKQDALRRKKEQKQLEDEAANQKASESRDRRRSGSYSSNASNKSTPSPRRRSHSRSRSYSASPDRNSAVGFA